MSTHPVPPKPEKVGPLTLADAEALRQHLDDLNDAGIDHTAVGMDARPSPFMVVLAGAYAETEVVLFGNPWDQEVDWGSGTHCNECTGQSLCTLDDLRYPVIVLSSLPPVQPDGGER